MKFWKYYQNKDVKKPQNIVRWDTKLYRSIDDDKAAQILRDIAVIKSGKLDGAFAQRFFEHFCTLHGLNPDTVPPPSGALA